MSVMSSDQLKWTSCVTDLDVSALLLHHVLSEIPNESRSLSRDLLYSHADAMFQVVKKLKEKEIKRQEHIYEFILTEKHHCLTLSVMQKV
jgi:hypothetical protein